MADKSWDDAYMYQAFESGPSVVAPIKVYGLASAWMSGKDVVMLVAENSEP